MIDWKTIAEMLRVAEAQPRRWQLPMHPDVRAAVIAEHPEWSGVTEFEVGVEDGKPLIRPIEQLPT